MKKLIATSLASLAVVGLVAAAPAQGQPQKKTELVRLGKSVDRMSLLHDFDGLWVVDNQNLLYRDTSRDYYLVTLKEACEPLDIRRRGFEFRPADPWQLRASSTYEIRPQAGPWCNVARIELIEDARASELRDEAKWRAW